MNRKLYKLTALGLTEIENRIWYIDQLEAYELWLEHEEAINSTMTELLLQIEENEDTSQIDWFDPTNDLEEAIKNGWIVEQE